MPTPGTAVPAAALSYAEYLALEDRAGSKHEYLRGAVWAMAGGSPEHGALAARVSALLDVALRGKPCRVFNSDVRIRVLATDLATYPDASVVCGRLECDPQDPQAIINPVLLVEVLSDSTEAYDRGEKAAHYRQIPSLQEYLLVSQREPRLELFRRAADRWELYEAHRGESLELRSVAAVLEADEVYQNPLASPQG